MINIDIANVGNWGYVKCIRFTMLYWELLLKMKVTLKFKKVKDMINIDIWKEDENVRCLVDCVCSRNVIADPV